MKSIDGSTVLIVDDEEDLLTAIAYDLTPQHAVESGAAAILSKPFDRKELMEMALAHLAIPAIP